MNQIICDACGIVIKNEPKQNYDMWGTASTGAGGAICVLNSNLDICESCWDKIKNPKA